MNSLLHPWLERFVNFPMACNMRLSFEFRRNNQHAQMPARLRARMPGMHRALIFHDQMRRSKAASQARFNTCTQRIAVYFLGRYLINHRLCAMIKITRHAVAPNSLKWAHAAVEKRYATTRLSNPSAAKNAIQAILSRLQMREATATCYRAAPGTGFFRIQTVQPPAPPRTIHTARSAST